MRRHQFLLVSLLIGLTVSILAGADQNEKPEKKSFRLKIGFSERIRQETWDNTVSFSQEEADSRSQLRLRSTLSLQGFFKKNLELALKLTNENRYYFAPKNLPWKIHETIVDNLYVKWDRVARLPLTLTVGRQNITFGEGFLVADGGPLDGSRSYYFNAARADYQIGSKKTLTAFFFFQDEFDGFPLINDQQQRMVEQPETGFGLYSNLAFNRSAWEPYLIVKHISASAAAPLASTITALGLRLATPLAESWKVRLEGAYQTGSLGPADRSALGGYVYVDFKPENRPRWPLELSVGGIFLSGDNPGSAACEGWDPLFSRWPKWSDSFIYALSRESRVAYWSNFVSLNGTLTFNFKPGLKTQLGYFHLWAAQSTSATPFLSGNGRDRGDLVIIRFLYDVSRTLAGRLIVERFWPGNFYAAGADPFTWIQFELFFKF